MSILSDLRKLNAFVHDTIDIYETLEQRLGHEPALRSALVPLVYRHAVEYNRKHEVIDPAFLTLTGQCLAVRYRSLQRYFTDPQGQAELQQLKEQLLTEAQV